MSNPFFEKPILNSPYAYPVRYWELDDTGQPTQRIIDTRRRAEFITPTPKARRQQGGARQPTGWMTTNAPPATSPTRTRR